MRQKITFLSLMMFFTLSLFAERSITGYVYDKAGEKPLVDAQITLKGTDKRITTDYEGFFELSVPNKKVTLVITYSGYEENEVLVSKNKKEVKVLMQKKAEPKKEVVEVPKQERKETKASVTASAGTKYGMITGFVGDESGEPLIGASVAFRDMEGGTVTEFDGTFALDAPEGRVVLVITYTGYKTVETVVKKDKRNIRVLMGGDVMLSELVVTSVSASREESSRKTKKDRRKAAAAKASAPPVTYSVITTEPAPVKKPAAAYDDVMTDMEAVGEVAVLSEEVAEVSEKIKGKTSGVTTNLPSAGQLTAGILNDYGKWNLWQDIQENELKEWQGTWDIRPWDRYPIQLTTQNGYPIVNAKVFLKEGSTTIWTARTDNTGKAELWANLYEQKEAGDYSMEIEYKGKTYELDAANSFHEGGNTKIIPVQCDISKTVDIAFVVDATGSMGDEINYLKSELTDVITRSKKVLKDVELRLGSVFYRDLGDAYVTRKSHFSTDINKTVEFIKEQKAAGGGDGPEAIEEALDEALDNMVWSENAAARLLFLVLDAPPHQTDAIKDRLKVHIERAAKMGIRIVPVACSGTGRSTEYLMRSFALATNGSYIYLTDDSGIGGSHQKPITDEHKVNLLNDLLVQTITDFSKTVSCDEQLDFDMEDIRDTMEVALVLEKQIDPNQQVDIVKNTEFSWKYYPNPSRGQLWIEIEGELDFLYLFDGAGKLLRRITITDQKFEIDIRDYPSGMYFLRGIGKDEREVSGKVVLVRSS